MLKAIPHDAPRIPEINLNHRGQRCTFEAIIEDYKISDPALHRLALIVRAADVKGQEDAAPKASVCGLLRKGSLQWGYPMKNGWRGNFQSMMRFTNMPAEDSRSPDSN